MALRGLKFDKADFIDYVKQMNEAWALIQRMGQKDIDGLVELRQRSKYGEYDQTMLDTLDQEGIVYAGGQLFFADILQKFRKDLGLFVTTRRGDEMFILQDRYCVPIKDMSGNVVAIVGWLNDSKKYLTTSSKYFSKNTMFYGLEDIKNSGPKVIVEGIFDRLAVKSTGVNAYATMGINADYKKRILYNLMGRVIGIPDADVQGTRVVKEDMWKLPLNSSYLVWRGRIDIGNGYNVGIKDIDDFCTMVEVEDIREMLYNAYASTKDRVVRIEI